MNQTATTSGDEELVKQQIEFICDLTGYGGQLHPNDIKHCFEKVVAAAKAEEIRKAIKEAQNLKSFHDVPDMIARLEIDLEALTNQ